MNGTARHPMLNLADALEVAAGEIDTEFDEYNRGYADALLSAAARIREVEAAGRYPRQSGPGPPGQRRP